MTVQDGFKLGLGASMSRSLGLSVSLSVYLQPKSYKEIISTPHSPLSEFPSLVCHRESALSRLRSDVTSQTGHT